MTTLSPKYQQTLTKQKAQCYKNKRVGEQVYKVIRKGIDPNATRYIDWLEKGVFEALNCGYLSDVLLEIYHPTARSTSNSGSASSSSAENTKRLCEMYAFSVVYGNSNIQLSLADTKESQLTKENTSQFQKKNIFKSSKQLLNAILRMTQSLAPLPTKHIISIRVRSCVHHIHPILLQYVTIDTDSNLVIIIIIH